GHCMGGRRGVVVTGIGVITSIGIGVASFWQRPPAGESGISAVESFDTTRYDVHRGGEVKGFDARPYVERLPLDSIARASQFAIAAARLALADAAIGLASVDADAVGVSIGTTSGEPELIERFDDLELAGARDRIGPEFL